MMETILTGINSYDITNILPLKTEPLKLEGSFSTALILAKVDFQQLSLKQLECKLLQSLTTTTPSWMSQHINSLLSTAHNIHVSVADVADAVQSCDKRLSDVTGAILQNTDDIKEQNRATHDKLEEVNENVSIEGRSLKRKIDRVAESVSDESRKVRMSVVQEGIYTGVKIKQETVEHVHESAQGIQEQIAELSGRIDQISEKIDHGKAKSSRKRNESKKGLYLLLFSLNDIALFYRRSLLLC